MYLSAALLWPVTPVSHGIAIIVPPAHVSPCAALATSGGGLSWPGGGPGHKMAASLSQALTYHQPGQPNPITPTTYKLPQ